MRSVSAALLRSCWPQPIIKRLVGSLDLSSVTLDLCTLTLPLRFHVPQNRVTDLVRENSFMLSSASPFLESRTEQSERFVPNR
jgi:hypothetical protein